VRAVRVISKQPLADFWRKHPTCRESLQAWYAEACHASWTSPQDIKQRYVSASFVAKNRVVFNIKGNEYRLVVAVAYKLQAVYIKFVGTHAQYDAIDVVTVELNP
jgi:mRNA interferase HigB